MHSVFVENLSPPPPTKQTLKYTKLKRDANLLVLYIYKKNIYINCSVSLIFVLFIS